VVRRAAFRIDGPHVHPDDMAAWGIHLGRSTVDAVGLRRALGAGDLASAFAKSAGRRPSFPALNLGGSSMTHGELDAAAGSAAATLLRLGSQPGESVLVVMESSLPTIVAYLAVLRTGASVVLANPSSTQVEVQRMVDDTAPRLVVGSGLGLETVASTKQSSVREVVGLSPEDRESASVLLQDQVGESLDARPLDPDSPAILAFTSGTTGRPKCAPLSHRNLLASIRGVMTAWNWSEAEHLVHALPISHQHGLGGIHAALLSGSQATVLPRFESAGLLEAVRRGATAMFAIPTIYQRLLAELGAKAVELGRLRLATSGSGPLPVDLAIRVQEALGELPLERYGSTEAGLNISNPLLGERIAGSVGLPLPGIEMAIASAAGDVLPTGEAGEILIRGPQVFSGYRSADASDAFLFDWFRTGDVGVIDEQYGYLRVVGRLKELIITGGMNVYPREVEDVLRSGTGVEDVVVVGVPSDRWGEEVVAFVSPRDVPVAELGDLATQALAPYKRPKRILTLPAIPRSAVGKVDNAMLLRLASGALD